MSPSSAPQPSPARRSAKLDQFNAASALSGHLDTRTAATEVAEALGEEMSRNAVGKPSGARMCDLVLMFGSYHHRAAFAEAAHTIRGTLAPQALLGVTAESVVGAEREVEGRAGLAVMALKLGDVQVTPWFHTAEQPLPMSRPDDLRLAVNHGPDSRAAIMLADPFSTPVGRVLPALSTLGLPGESAVASDAARPAATAAATGFPVVGGLASGASQPGHNVLVVNDHVASAGMVGVTLNGPIDVSVVVSQGCRAVGSPLVVTKAKDNIILELGGKRAVDVVKEMAQEFSEEERQLLSRGLLVGLVINEYKDRFGRGDFLVRNVLGYDQRVGGIAIGDVPRVGQTIQFHVRDAETAGEDLDLLLEGQALSDPPFAGLLITCNGRGSKLFGEPNHDVNMIRRRLGPVPLAGFFAAGEFGPVGGRSFLHGHTAALALFRAR